ncbi:MAG: hypothetical protein H0X62_09940, partial [Bacteroidetes bacterium]|nr:hypothetical protein [Bacteroidota bacterium]
SIEGRKKYNAIGNYDYVDEFEKVQTIHFNNIMVDTTGQTTASGLIIDETEFTLSPQFDYKGKVKLEATKQFLTFEGLTRINHSCESVPRNWMQFNAEINPKEILIPVAIDPLNENNTKLATGMMLANDSIGVYSAFLSRKHRPSDFNVVTADGFLFYDRPSEEFRISSKEKLKELALTGNYISLNTKDCRFFGEGKIDLGCDLGGIKLNSAGEASHNLNNNQALYDMVFSMNFFFDESALDKMAESMNKSSAAQGVDYSRKVFEKSLRELIGKENADKLISELNIYGGSYRRFPSALNHSIFFTDVKFKWIEELKTYRSIGKIGIGNVQKTQVNRSFDGNIEIQKKRGGDIMYIYFNLGEGNWYYFKYQKNFFYALSSNEEFNNIIKGLKQDKKKYKTKKGESPFQFNIGTPTDKNKFLRRLESDEESE